MAGCYAVLVDGGFLKYQLGNAASPMDSAKVTDFVERIGRLPDLAGLRLHRVYFYDAKPLTSKSLNPIDGTSVDFAASRSAERNQKLHAALARAPFFALRFGDLFQEGWQLKKDILKKGSIARPLIGSDIKPNIRQKGVDMRIGLDIASLTLKGHVQVIVLVTADSDFIPAMKFARREGAQLFLVALGHGLKEGMHEHADLVINTLP
jgi:uncharacterized LabA/DUF88 family protein